jgi:hypothetical protein
MLNKYQLCQRRFRWERHKRDQLLEQLEFG